MVDDGSTDGTVDIARRAGAMTITQAPRWAAAARNLGASVAQGELLLFTDADCAPTPGLDFGHHRAVLPTGRRRRRGGRGERHVPDAAAQRRRAVHPARVRRPVRPHGRRRADRLYRHVQRSVPPRRIPANGGFDPRISDQRGPGVFLSAGRKGLPPGVCAGAHRCITSTTAPWASTCRRKFKIGMWKVRVTRQHPTQVVQDSHTPGALKAAAAACGLGAWCCCSHQPSRAWGLGRPGGLAGLRSSRPCVAFDVTAFPFFAKIVRQRSRGAACPAWSSCGSRALALGFGSPSAWPVFPDAADEPRPAITVAQRAAKRLLDLVVRRLDAGRHGAADGSSSRSGSSWIRPAPSCSGRRGWGRRASPSASSSFAPWRRRRTGAAASSSTLSASRSLRSRSPTIRV